MPWRKPTPWNSYWQGLGDGQICFTQEGVEAVNRLCWSVPVKPTDVVLDYGCGYGHAVRQLAKRAGQVYFWDLSESMLTFARKFLEDIRNASCWDPDTTPTTFDIVWCNSVVQYMTATQFSTWLVDSAQRLNPGGRIIVSDLIPPGHRFLSDAVSLALFSLRKGYFFQAWSSTRKLTKRYDDIKSSQPLYQPTDNELSQFASVAGLTYATLKSNLTHFRGRRSVLFTRSAT
jgi:2-polyprenyl-3-methyl-5-hydroxy-6-metoxy-1,4-benzoquinol methylase